MISWRGDYGGYDINVWKECSFTWITQLPERVTFVGDVNSSEQPRDSLATPTLHPPDSIQRTEVEYASLTGSLVHLGKLKSSDWSGLGAILYTQSYWATTFLTEERCVEAALHVSISANFQEDSHSFVGSSTWGEN